MSRIEELADAIGNLASKIDEVVAETAGAGAETEDMSTNAQALGATNMTDGLAQVKDQLDALSQTLRGASERAGEIQALTLTVGDGT